MGRLFGPILTNMGCGIIGIMVGGGGGERMRTVIEFSLILAVCFLFVSNLIQLNLKKN